MGTLGLSNDFHKHRTSNVQHPMMNEDVAALHHPIHTNADLFGKNVVMVIEIDRRRRSFIRCWVLGVRCSPMLLEHVSIIDIKASPNADMFSIFHGVSCLRRQVSRPDYRGAMGTLGLSNDFHKHRTSNVQHPMMNEDVAALHHPIHTNADLFGKNVVMVIEIDRRRRSFIRCWVLGVRCSPMLLEHVSIIDIKASPNADMFSIFHGVSCLRRQVSRPDHHILPQNACHAYEGESPGLVLPHGEIPTCAGMTRLHGHRPLGSDFFLREWQNLKTDFWE